MSTLENPVQLGRSPSGGVVLVFVDRKAEPDFASFFCCQLGSEKGVSWRCLDVIKVLLG